MADLESDPNEVRLRSVDSAILTPVVERRLNCDNLVITHFEHTKVHGGIGGGIGGTAIYRFTGEAYHREETIPWSLILKIVQTRPGESPDSTHYWKREAEAYRSGILDNLPGGLFAAKGLGVIEYPDDSCWIWQELVEDGVGKTWEMEHYRLAARHLGRFNGAYLTANALPNYEWFSIDWLRKIALVAEPHAEPIREMLRSPDLKLWLRSDAEEQYQRFWADRERLLNALDRLPQTLSHQDPIRGNLFLRRGAGGDLETVAIDWAYFGIAAVGMEIAVPLIINLLFSSVHATKAVDLKLELFEGYLEGLRESGFAGDMRQVRLGYTASSVCKFFEILMFAAIEGLFDPDKSAVWEGALGTSIGEIRSGFGAGFNIVCLFADEARTLMDELGY